MDSQRWRYQVAQAGEALLKLFTPLIPFLESSLRSKAGSKIVEGNLTAEGRLAPLAKPYDTTVKRKSVRPQLITLNPHEIYLLLLH